MLRRLRDAVTILMLGSLLLRARIDLLLVPILRRLTARSTFVVRPRAWVGRARA